MNETKELTPEMEKLMVTDYLRMLFFSRIAKAMCEAYIATYEKYSPNGVNNSAYAITREVKNLEKKALRISTGSGTAEWLERELNKEKTLDLMTLAELMMRVDVEERHAVYGTVMSIITEAIDVIFYAQEHRANIHIPKYRALFKMLVDEMRQDVHDHNKDGTKNRLFMKHGKDIFIRVNNIIEPEIEQNARDSSQVDTQS